MQQCGTLTFVEPEGHCTDHSFHTYSLASPTAAAASDAAADERALAVHAVSIAPPPPTAACAAAIRVPPTLACVSNTCRVAAPVK